jgi:hypothetical protein
MLEAVAPVNLNVAVCTIYYAVAVISAIEVTALSLFNDVVTDDAIGRDIPIVDLRHVSRETEDYSPISPIEPSCQGAEKIAATVLEAEVNEARANANRSESALKRAVRLFNRVMIRCR